MSGIDYAAKYKCLKQKMKILVYEQEVLTTELEKLQSSLLKVSQDNSFLLDNLLQHEHLTSNSPVDSEATISSDSEYDYTPPLKKRASQPSVKQVKTENVEIETGVTNSGKATANEEPSRTGEIKLANIDQPIIVSDDATKDPT